MCSPSPSSSLCVAFGTPDEVEQSVEDLRMSNELNNIVALNTDGVREGIAIGGDRWPGVRFLDVLLRFEADPILGEV